MRPLNETIVRSKMSGVKIDLDEAREQNAFVKTKIIVQEDGVPHPQTVPLVAPLAPKLVEETLDEAIAKPVKERSSSKVTISDEARHPAVEPSAPAKSAGSSSRVIASAIKEAMNSARKSEREATRPGSSRRATTRLGEASARNEVPRTVPAERVPGLRNVDDRPKIPLPEEPEKLPDGPPVDHERPDADRDEIDMMPKTDGELRVYWTTRLMIIKTRFQDVIIPRKVAEMTWQEIRKIYYIELDRVSITKNVDSYKTILTVLFFIAEYIGARFIKIDCTGFSAHSMRSMHRYDRLLIELGEKNYSSFGENWPVEFRLGAMVIVNFVIFCIAKYLFKLTGQDMSDNFFEMFQSLGSATVESDLPQAAGMNAPAPGAATGEAGGGGLMSMLSGLLGNLGGGKGGGLEGILGNLMGGMGQAPKPGTTSAAPPKADADGNRVTAPRYRRKKKPATAQAGASPAA